MNTAWILAALAIGAVLGAFYFGGLWLTVRRVAIAQQPALLLFVSFLTRVGVVLFGMYFVMGGRWERLVACMAGFLLARTLLICRLRDVADNSALSTIAVQDLEAGKTAGPSRCRTRETSGLHQNRPNSHESGYGNSARRCLSTSSPNARRSTG